MWLLTIINGEASISENTQKNFTQIYLKTTFILDIMSLIVDLFCIIFQSELFLL